MSIYPLPPGPSALSRRTPSLLSCTPLPHGTSRYDGALGIIVGMAAIKHTVLQAAQQAGVDLAGSIQQAGAPVPEGAVG
eukprot:1158335-Pelagomonas_calceolata.AAC.11